MSGTEQNNPWAQPKGVVEQCQTISNVSPVCPAPHLRMSNLQTMSSSHLLVAHCQHYQPGRAYAKLCLVSAPDTQARTQSFLTLISKSTTTATRVLHPVPTQCCLSRQQTLLGAAESERGWRHHTVWSELLCHGQIPGAGHRKGPQKLHRQPQGMSKAGLCPHH